MLPGNTINLTYTDTATNTQHQISIVNVTDPAALPLQNGAECQSTVGRGQFPQPAWPAMVAQLNTALGTTGLSFNPCGDDAQCARIDGHNRQCGLDARSRRSRLASGIPQFALFTDGNSLYTGQITANGSQMTGLAGRISDQSGACINNPSTLSVYSDLAADAGRRQHAFGFPVLATDHRPTFTYSP